MSVEILQTQSDRQIQTTQTLHKEIKDTSYKTTMLKLHDGKIVYIYFKNTDSKLAMLPFFVIQSSLATTGENNKT